MFVPGASTPTLESGQLCNGTLDLSGSRVALSNYGCRARNFQQQRSTQTLLTRAHTSPPFSINALKQYRIGRANYRHLSLASVLHTEQNSLATHQRLFYWRLLWKKTVFSRSDCRLVDIMLATLCKPRCRLTRLLASRLE